MNHKLQDPTRYRYCYYTDGSLQQDGSCGAAYIQWDETLGSWTVREKFKLRQASIQLAEITGLVKACEHYNETEKKEPAIIYTDRMGILSRLKKGRYYDVMEPVITFLNNNPQNKIEWVKAHAGLMGNELADQLAKEACTNGTPIAMKWLYPFIRQVSKEMEWRKVKSKMQKNFPLYRTRRRKRKRRMKPHLEQIMTSYRLSGLPTPRYAYDRKMKLYPRCQHCDCDGTQSHYIYECSLLTDERMVFIREMKSLYDKYEKVRQNVPDVAQYNFVPLFDFAADREYLCVARYLCRVHKLLTTF